MKSGIYQILNHTNNKCYIGSSKHLLNRWSKEHKPALNSNKHYNRHLQNAWNKYGETNFEFIILEECPIEKLTEKEEYWIENHKSWDRNYGYNLTRFANGRRIISDETRQNMSESAIKSWKEKEDEFYNTGTRLQVVQLFKQGVSKNKITKLLNIDRNTVYDILIYHKLHINTGRGKIIKLTDVKLKEIKVLREQGLSWCKIADDLKIGRTQLNRKGICKKLTLPVFTEEIKIKALKLRDEGKSWKEISKETGFSVATFYRNKLNEGNSDSVRKRITNEIKQSVLNLREQGLTIHQIANELNIGTSSVHRIIK